MTEPIRSNSPRPTAASNPVDQTEPTQPRSVPSEQPLSEAEDQLVDSSLARGAGSLLPKPGRSTEWYEAKLKAETACLFPGDFAFRVAKQSMDTGGLAEKMLDHFVDGRSEPVYVNLTEEFERNPQLRQFVASHIEYEMAQRANSGEPVENMTGAVWVPQSAYGRTDAGQDQQRALGGTFFEYQVNGSLPDGSLAAQILVSDHYFWSPSETNRPTHCLHQRGAELVAAGKATEFHQYGEGNLTLNNPLPAQPMLPLQPQGNRRE